MPLDPAVELTGLDVKNCGVFNSNAVPLKLAFTNRDPLGMLLSGGGERVESVG